MPYCSDSSSHSFLQDGPVGNQVIVLLEFVGSDVVQAALGTQLVLVVPLASMTTAPPLRDLNHSS